MDEEVKKALIQAGRADLIEAHEIGQSGWGGINRSGQVVDRRRHPRAVALVSNETIGIPKPKQLPEGAAFQIILLGQQGKEINPPGDIDRSTFKGENAPSIGELIQEVIFRYNCALADYYESKAQDRAEQDQPGLSLTKEKEAIK